MEKPHHNIVIVGDVDHGKSTLIGRLLLDTKSLPDNKLAEIKAICREQDKPTELAYLTDQLQEERENNMTIDTAQTFLKTPQAGYTLIDAPGHVKFIKNMLSGAAQANAAILIIDINQDIQKQTFRHAYLLQMLGIKNIIIVLNKIDLAEYQNDKFINKKRELSGLLHTLNITPSYIIPSSAKEAVNITRKSRKTAWYKGKTIIQALDALSTSKEHHTLPLRLPIQDVYTITGEKIIVGEITSGQIKAGQEITVLPLLRNTLVRSIRIFGKSTRKASQGESIGLTLADPSFIKRGHIISAITNTPLTTKHFSSELFWFGKNPLKINAPVTITCATQTIEGHVTNIQNKKDSSTMKAIKKSPASLHTHELATIYFSVKEPIVIEKTGVMNSLGKFVITQGARLQGAGIFC